MRNEQEIQSEIIQLVNFLNYQNYCYHVEGKINIDDSCYDSLFQRLISLENNYPHLKQENSPTEKIGFVPPKENKKYQHSKPMYGLTNGFNTSDIEKFLLSLQKYNKLKRYVNEFWCDPKCDGIALELIYCYGKVQYALTRGDGHYGEIIPTPLKNIKNIPFFIPDLKNEPFLSVRGEIVLLKKTFLEINQNLTKKFKTARNAAIGIIQKMKTNTSEIPLYFFAYDMFFQNSDFFKQQKITSHHKLLMTLQNLGFETPNPGSLCKNISDIQNYVKKIEKQRDSLNFDIDGVVIKHNDLEIQKNIGHTSRVPKFALAYKYPAKESLTKILDIQFKMSRNGVLTPVAILEPVTIENTTISKVNLFNLSYIQQNQLRINDFVIVGKSGEVIPKIIRNLPDLRNEFSYEFKPPQTCPYCQKKLKVSGKKIFCANKNCCEKILKETLHFIKKKLLIKGINENILRELIKKEKIHSPIDILQIEENDLSIFFNNQNKTVSKLIKQINGVKKDMILT